MPITKIHNTKQIESENYYFTKYIRHDYIIFKYNNNNVVFFKLNDELYYCLQDDMTNFFDVDFLKNTYGVSTKYKNNKLFDERFEKFMEDELIFNIPLNKKIYHENTVFCGMSQFIITPFSENEIWFCDIYTNDIYLTNFEIFETKRKHISLQIESIHFITNYFFILNIDETKNKQMYYWNDLTFPKNMTPVMEIYDNDEKWFSINYKGSIMAKICDFTIEFYDENFVVVYKINNFFDLLNYKSIKIECCYEHQMIYKPNVEIIKIYDNCLFYYESIDLVCNKHQMCNGMENKYCYDFINEKNVIFKNNTLDFYVRSGIPFREDNKVKLLMYEYFPASSWRTIYEAVD